MEHHRSIRNLSLHLHVLLVTWHLLAIDFVSWLIVTLDIDSSFDLLVIWFFYTPPPKLVESVLRTETSTVLQFKIELYTHFFPYDNVMNDVRDLVVECDGCLIFSSARCRDVFYRRFILLFLTSDGKSVNLLLGMLLSNNAISVFISFCWFIHFYPEPN